MTLSRFYCYSFLVWIGTPKKLFHYLVLVFFFCKNSFCLRLLFRGMSNHYEWVYCSCYFAYIYSFPLFLLICDSGKVKEKCTVVESRGRLIIQDSPDYYWADQNFPLLLHVGSSEYTIFYHCEVELRYWTGFTCWYYSYFSIACYTFDISFCYVFYHSKPLLFKYILFLFFLVSVVACESGKMEELCEVELWHWRVCTWIYGSSLAWFGLLERFSLVLLCFVCIYA